MTQQQTPRSSIFNNLGLFVAAQAQKRAYQARNVLGRAFNPGLPLVPTIAAGKDNDENTGGPRYTDYPQSANIVFEPREEYEDLPTFQQLRNFARLYDISALCVSALCQEIAALQGSVAAKDKNQQKVFEENGDIDRIRRFLDSPDRMHDLGTWLQMLTRDILEIAAPVLYPDYTEDGRLYSLEIIDGSTVKLIIDDRGRPIAAQQIIKGLPASNYWLFGKRNLANEQYLATELFPNSSDNELIYRPYNPRSDNPYGIAPSELVIMRINTALRKQDFDLKYFTEGNLPEMLLAAPNGTLTPQQVNDFETYFNAMLAGNSAMRRRAKFLPWEPNAVVTKSFSYDTALDEYMGKLTMAAYGVTPAELGFTDDVNRASSDGQENVQERRGIKPLARFLKNLLDLIIQHPRLLNAPDLEWHWQFGSQEDKLARANEFQIYIQNGIVTPQEARLSLFGGEIEGDAPGLQQIVAIRQSGRQQQQTATTTENDDATNTTKVLKYATTQDSVGAELTKKQETKRRDSEIALAALIAALYASQKTQLKALAEKIAANPENAEKLIADAEQQMQEDMFAELVSYYDATLQNAIDEANERLDNDSVNYDALTDNAIDTSKELAQQFAQESVGTTFSGFRKVTKDILEGVAVSVAIRRIGRILNKGRIDSAAITENTKLYAKGNELGFGNTVADTVKGYIWHTVENACPVCVPLNNTTVTGTFPPLHVRCRCYIRPIFKG